MSIFSKVYREEQRKTLDELYQECYERAENNEQTKDVREQYEELAKILNEDSDWDDFVGGLIGAMMDVSLEYGFNLGVKFGMELAENNDT